MKELGSWSEIYRPKTIEETILPEHIKDRFRKYVKEGYVPNLILFGPSGTGKTTIAKAALDELGCDVYFINGSLKNGIDTLRYEISNFASSISFTGGRKYVIIDEADWISINTQAAFRSFMADFDENCGFIFTCNYPKRIMPELHSRFSSIDFNFEADDKAKLASQYLKRLAHILDIEGVEYDKRILASLITKYFPDFRKVLIEVQGYASKGKIDEGIFTRLKIGNVHEVFGYIKEKKFEEIRKWAAENSYQDANTLFKEIYNVSETYVERNSMPNLIVLLGEYQYKHAFVADPEINVVALLTEIMIGCNMK